MELGGTSPSFEIIANRFVGARNAYLQLQITMNDTFRMEISDRRQHLFDQSRALGFRVMIVRLLVQSIKQVATQAQFLYDIYFVDRLVHLLDSKKRHC
jgi:hypothetical protein